MSGNANCPYCQAPLNVTDTVVVQPTVCPHCLTNIANPRMAAVAEAPNVLKNILRDGTIYGRGLKWAIALCVAFILGCFAFGHISRHGARFDTGGLMLLG